jgi:hypothetical protein
MPEGTVQTGGTPETPNQGGTPNAGGQTSETTGERPASFEAWLANQDDATKALLDGHTKGLKSALESERTQRAELAKQLRDVSGKLEKGSDAEKAVANLQAQLDAKSREADFIAAAIRPEVGCSNPKLAYMLASAENLYDRRGNPDWDAIKAAAPELFQSPAQPLRPGSADAGAGRGQNRPLDMNSLIRRAAGRG